MENLHRLFTLDRLLRGLRRPVPIKTLLAEMECSYSTFKRLIKTLREQYHYPIIYSQQHKGYYYDHTQAMRISGLWFNANELQALLIIQQMLQRLQPGLLNEYFQPLTKHVNKLLTSIGKTPSNITKRINIIPIAHQYIATEIFLPLCQATLYSYAIKIHYQDIHGQHSERIVSPQRLVYYRNNWYLDAWCHLRQSLRTFWVAGIQALASSTDQAAQLVEEKILEVHLESSYGIFTGPSQYVAHLRFTGRAAMRTRGSEWHPMQQQRSNADGSLELMIPYSDPRELIMDIMRYGAEVEVLAPESLKMAVIQQCKMTLALYENMRKNSAGSADEPATHIK